jgi:hypothetical protein
MVSSPLCPVCKIGFQKPAAFFVDNKLQNQNVVTRGVKDPEVEEYMNGVGIPYPTTGILTCSYCGFTAYSVDVIKERNLNNRKLLS